MDSSSNSFLVDPCNLKFTATVRNPIEYNYRPRSVAVGDFNNDDSLDIVVANYATDNIAVFLGYGNGTFASSQLYPTGSHSSPYMVAVGDFNNDSKLDITVANFGTNCIGLFLGFGNGSFAHQMTISTESSRPRWIFIDDVNNDSISDIILSLIHI